RAMHHPRVFRWMYRVHHRSHNPSPWAAYAFAPSEALVHAAFVPLVTLVMPVNGWALFAFLGFMIARNVLGHLGVELFPAGCGPARDPLEHDRHPPRAPPRAAAPQLRPVLHVVGSRDGHHRPELRDDLREHRVVAARHRGLDLEPDAIAVD